MRTFEWKNRQWITQERWGQVHPEKSHWWYDESCVYVDNDDFLHLTTKHNPRYFPEIDKTSSIGVGLVSCAEKFSFGTYSIVAKLPKGPNLWPAFWMWSWDSWPPEIDVFEGYSNSRGSYLKPRIKSPLGFWNVQTNVHYREENRNRMIGGQTSYMGLKDPSENFIQYTLVWQKDSIMMYYNTRCVRRVTDPRILRQFENTTMNVVINNGVTEEVDIHNPSVSDFVIKDFKYSPIYFPK